MRKRKSCIVEVIVLITCIWLMVVGAHAEITLPFTSQQPVSTLQASSDVVFNTDEGTYTIDGITFSGGNRVDAGQNSPYVRIGVYGSRLCEHQHPGRSDGHCSRLEPSDPDVER